MVLGKTVLHIILPVHDNNDHHLIRESGAGAGEEGEHEGEEQDEKEQRSVQVDRQRLKMRMLNIIIFIQAKYQHHNYYNGRTEVDRKRLEMNMIILYHHPQYIIIISTRWSDGSSSV